VSTLENRLRDAYRAAAGTIDPATIPSLAVSTRSRAALSRRARFAAPLAAAAAVTLAVVIPTLVAGTAPPWHHAQTVKPRSTAAAIAPAPPALPAFTLVDLGSSLKVYDTRTGAAVATLAAPAGQQFEDVASGGTARAFLAATGLSGTGPACHAYFYRFELSATGQPSPLTLLRSVPGSQPTAIAATAGGGTYAYSTVHCNFAPPNGVIGISGQAGNRTWDYDMGDDYSFSLAATADGRELAYSVITAPGAGLLNTSSVAATVSGASRVLSSVPVSATLAISPDGRALYACASSGTTATLAAYSTATGARTRVLHQWTMHSSPYPAGSLCQISTDPTGRFLLAAATADLHGPSALIGFDLSTGASVTLPVHPTLLFRGTQLAW
jgi:hypothetical protein